MKTKLLRITTVPISLKILLRGQHSFMSKKGFEVIGISSPGQELIDVGNEEGINVYPLEMTRTISPLKDLLSLLKFYRICRQERPNIVHSHTPKAGIVGMLGAKLAGVPVRIHTVAGMPLMESSGAKRKILNFVEKFTYACATKVYPNSKGLYDFILEQNFVSKNKLHVIGNGSSNGIDTIFFSREALVNTNIREIKSNLGINANDFVFIFVGRLVGDKGINELIAAFEDLKEPLAKLILVGPLESDLDPLLPRTLKAINCNKNIISVGFQKDVRPYFAVSNVLVFPSYREGFPNVVMQAGAMGLPSIVSNINGCNEIIIDGENGVIIPVKNTTHLRDAMLKFLNDKNFYNYLKSNARNYITNRYEQKLVWEAILSEYKEQLKIVDEHV